MVKNNSEKVTKIKERTVKKKVDFSLNAPEAKEVFLTGEFNHWDTQSMPMKRDKKGIWRFKAQLAPGRYEYKFYGNGSWLEGPAEAGQVDNLHGTKNFVIEVQ